MADQDLLLQALRSFAVSMGTSYDVTEMSYQLCDRVTDALSASGAGVSVVDGDNELRFVTATDEVTVQMEEAQEKGQEGPCVTAFLNHQAVTVGDIRTARDWPGYAAVAQNLGLQAVVGYPLSHNDRIVGALNLYDSKPREWTDDDLDVIGVFADMATAYLVRASELAESRRLTAQLQQALDSRVVVEQAKGILAGELGITVDEAFHNLRRHSRENNLKLADLCHAVVNLGLRIPDSRKDD